MTTDRYKKAASAYMAGLVRYAIWRLAGGEPTAFCVTTMFTFESRRYAKGYATVTMIENVMDIQASTVKSVAWFQGLRKRGFIGAQRAAAGLS